MGEHGTWFDYLNRFSWWQSLTHKAEDALGRGWKFMVFQDSHFSLTHVLITALDHDGIARAFTHSYEAPELYTTGASTPTTDLFSAALTLWTGFTGAHPYRVTPHDVDEDVIAADDHGPFAGPVELGRILEPILRADPATRPSITQVDDQLRHLAHGWGLGDPAISANLGLNRLDSGP